MSEKSDTKKTSFRTVVVKTPITETSRIDETLPVYCAMCDTNLCNYSSWRTHKSKFHRRENFNFNRQELKTVVTPNDENSTQEEDDDDNVERTTESEDKAMQMIDEFLGKDQIEKSDQKQLPQNSNVESSALVKQQDVESESVISKAEMAKHHIAMACSILLEPFTKINGGQKIHESENTHEFVADQIVYAAITEYIAARGTDILEITTEEEVENAYGMLRVLNEINMKRRNYDSEVRWKKMLIVEDKLLKRIGQFHAKRHLGLCNSGGGASNHKVKFADLEQEKIAQPSSEADNSQKSKKQKNQ